MPALNEDEPYPDVKNALRAAWQEATQQLEAKELAFEAAQRAVAEARSRADEVRRQIEAACPALGLDPSEVMTAPAKEPSVGAKQPHQPRPEYVGPRAQYAERLSDLLADGRLVAGEQLRTIHHGREHFARIERDGSVTGAEIGSWPTLSAAARALVGGERNGWKFWSVRRDGRWIPVAQLRTG